MARGQKTGGRRKGTPNKATADVKALAQKYTEKAVNALARIMDKGETDAARVAAIKELLDRGHGKSSQIIDATIKDDRMVVEAPSPAKTTDDWVSQHGPH